MASFELTSSSCDGHIRALSKAVLMANKISRDALLEFNHDKLKLCSRTDLFLVKFVFDKDFFTDYTCDTRHKVFINLKALQMPFKSSILIAERDSSIRSQIKLRCSVEDQLNNQIVFKIGAEQPAASLTYRLSINDIDPDRMAQLSASNRSINYERVKMTPSKKERFLLSAFKDFAPDIDQVTIKTSHSGVKFIGSNSPLLNNTNMTVEFAHKREDFTTFEIKEDVNITIPLRSLKLFLTFVETNKIQTCQDYIFEGQGLPAHFIYKSQLFKGHFISSTPYEYIPDELEDDALLQIAAGANESFIAEENVIQPEEDAYDDREQNYNNEYQDEEEEDYGYNENRSDDECELLDGNLEGLNTSVNKTSYLDNSIFGAESIRSEITDMVVDPERAREILNLDEDPDDIENVVIQYSSDSSED